MPESERVLSSRHKCKKKTHLFLNLRDAVPEIGFIGYLGVYLVPGKNFGINIVNGCRQQLFLIGLIMGELESGAIRYRQIGEKDNRELAALIRTVFREFRIDIPGTVYFDPTTDSLYELFRASGSVYWIAEEGGKMIGGCGIYPTAGLPEGCAELVKFYLLAPWRGKGIGRTLMEKCFESARQMGYRQLYLESLPELSKAVSMYIKSGFEHIPHSLGNSGHFGCNIWMLKDL
jgi:putative acetyltransferase